MSSRAHLDRRDAPAAEPVTDAALVTRSREDPDAFVALFDRHYDAVHRYVHRRAGRELADELAAETFVRAFARRAAFEPRADGALPWLYGIATNLLRRHRRTEERQLRAYARSGRDEVVVLEEDALAERVDARVRARELAGALAALSADVRDTVCLVSLAGLTHEQAAVALDVPFGTIASRIHRAHARLRARLGAGHPREEERP